MSISDYLAEQMREALGPINKEHCSKHYGREVSDAETLLRFYIKNGGARHLAQYAGTGGANGQAAAAQLPLAKAA